MVDNCKINTADFGPAMELHQVILREIAKTNFDFVNLLKERRIDDLIKVVLSLMGSSELLAALWPCLIRCTYKDEKITQEMFDRPGMRKLFHPIAAECIKVNNTDFFEGVPSMSSMIFEKLTASDTPE